MKKMYLNLPTLDKLEMLLKETFNLSDTLTGADIVITEGELEFINGKLVISVSDRRRDSGTVYISKSLSTEAIYQAIRASVDTYTLTSSHFSFNPSYHVLKDSDPQVGYLVKKLENILNSAAESILEIDEFGSVLFHNKKFATVYDSVNTVFDGSIFSVFDADTASSVRQILLQVTADTPMEFSGRIRSRNGALLPVEGYITVLPGDTVHYEIIFEDVTEKLLRRQKVKKSQEQTIVAGFARHLSHNVMNALTAAGGFIKKVQAVTDHTLYTQNLWHIINDKLMLIEEIVAGYNDYTHAASLRKTENIDLTAFFRELTENLAKKDVDRSFTAYLYKLTDGYSLSYDFAHAAPFFAEANKMFLKLAVCYIFKDNIRYFSGNLPIEYKVSVATSLNSLTFSIVAVNVDVSEQIVETMLKPWDHKMLSQSFDYWGIMIASAVIEKHNGKLRISREDGKLKFDLIFNKI